MTMKITEIISEISIQEGFYDKAFGRAFKTKPRNTSTPSTAPQGSGSTPPSWSQRYAQNAQARAVRRAQAKANVENLAIALERDAPEITKLLKTLLLWGTVIEYWFKIQELHAKYDGSDEEDEKNPDFIKERLHLRGVLITQWLAPKIVNLGLNATKVASLGILPVVIMAMRRFPRSSIVVDLTKPVVRAAVTAFVVSPPGARFLAELLGDHIDSIGSLPTIIGTAYDAIEKWITDNPDTDSSGGSRDKDGDKDVGGTSSSGGQSSGQGAQNSNRPSTSRWNELQKVNPYDFDLKDVRNKK